MEKTKELVLVWGRFVIPQKGHGKLFTIANQLAKKNNADLRIYATHTVDREKNPIPYDQKIKFLKLSFPEFQKNIIVSDAKTIFDVLNKVDKEGYTKITMVAGADRQEEFRKSISPYVNTSKSDFANLKSFKVVSAGRRDPESKDYLETLSSSYLRQMADEGKFDKFREGISSKLKPELVKDLYNKLRATNKEINKLKECMDKESDSDRMWRSFKQWYIQQDEDTHEERPDSDFLVVTKDGKRSLPVKKYGKIDNRLLGSAHAALLGGGYRGRKYEGSGKAAAIAKLKILYRKAGKKLPGE